MTKILQLFSLLFIFLFSAAFADTDLAKFDAYRLTVTQVDPEFHSFALSNGMVLTTLKAGWRFEILPEAGTEIYLRPKIRWSRGEEEKSENGEFWIFYTQIGRKRGLLGWMSAEPYQKMLTYVSTALECTQPAGWIFSAKSENVIELSDGSKWISKKIPKFDPGDHLVVSHDIETDQWFLIDITQESFVETNRVLVIYYSEIEVKPYRPAPLNE